MSEITIINEKKIAAIRLTLAVMGIPCHSLLGDEEGGLFITAGPSFMVLRPYDEARLRLTRWDRVYDEEVNVAVTGDVVVILQEIKTVSES